MLVINSLIGFGSGGSAVRTQSDFDSHVISRATDNAGELTSLSLAVGSFFTGAGTWRFDLSADHSGTMYGSPWGEWTYAQDSTPASQFINHCVESAAMYDQLRGASQSEILIVIATESNSLQNVSVTRNGYTSSSVIGGGPYTNYKVTEITYWDTAAGYAKTGDPFAESSFTQYTW